MISQFDASNSTFYNVAGNQYNATYNFLNDADTLKALNPTFMDASDRQDCLAGTRSDIIALVVEWASRQTEYHNILWLHGLAGSGKSTLSTTIANHFREASRLGAFLFFSRDVAERSDPGTVIRTLAYQLGCFNSRIAQLVSDAIKRTPGIAQCPLRLQWTKLIVEPLLTLQLENEHAEMQPLVVVIDSLDECGNPKRRQELLDIISKDTAGLHSILRMLITSRAEVDIVRKLKNKPNILAKELDITSPLNQADILAYFHSRLEEIREENDYLPLSEDWPGDERLGSLSNRACGLFVWAFTACNFIEDGHDPDERLGILLGAENVQEAQHALDVLYRSALASAGKWSDPKFASEFRVILGTILVAKQPLTCQEIDALILTKSYPALHTLTHFRCLVHCPENAAPVRILHPSFADFLTDRDRCESGVWYIDTEPLHSEMSSHSILLLTKTLHLNICNLTLSRGTSFKADTLPLAVSYAAIFWIPHSFTGSTVPMPVRNKIFDFLKVHFLHWLEVMSILNLTRSTVGYLTTLVDSCSGAGNLSLIVDCLRFAQTFAATCEAHPLLVYRSALAFSPTESLVYRKFNEDHWQPIPHVVGSSKLWSPLLLVITDHRASVTSVKFSPDDKLIMSASGDATIRLMDAKSGALVAALVGHKDGIMAATFSPNGKEIASGSLDYTVRLWDVAKGTPLMEPLRGHTGTVISLAFSPNQTRLASGSKDATVRVWDISLGTQTMCITHNTMVKNMSFFHCSTRFLSTQERGLVLLTDIVSGGTHPLMKGLAGDIPVYGVETICSKIREAVFLASSDHISSLMLGQPRERVIGRIPTTLTQHETVCELPVQSISSFALNDSEDVIVAATTKESIWVWRSSDSPPVLLNTRRGSVLCVALNRSGDRCISGSMDKSVTLWDTSPDIYTGDLNVAPPNLGSAYLSFSPNSALVTVCSGWLMHTWNAVTGSALPTPPRLRTSAVRHVVFSPSGCCMAAISDNNTLRVWDALTGNQLIESREFTWSTTAFSPDEKLLACGTHGVDASLIILDIQNGEEQLAHHVLVGHNKAVLCLDFSPNGDLLASGSLDMSIKLWDLKDMNCTMVIEHQAWVSSLSFSPDGNQLVSASDDGIISRWDISTSEATRQGMPIIVALGNLRHPALHVCFARGNRHVVCRLANEEIRVYDLSSGSCTSSDLLAGNFITHHPCHPIVITRDGWIIDYSYPEPIVLSKLPSTILPESLVATAACPSAISFTTKYDIFFVHFTSGPYSSAPESFQARPSAPSIREPETDEQLHKLYQTNREEVEMLSNSQLGNRSGNSQSPPPSHEGFMETLWREAPVVRPEAGESSSVQSTRSRLFPFSLFNGADHQHTVSNSTPEFDDR